MNNYFKSFILGIFTLGALSLFVLTILFLKPSVGDMKQTLHVRFADINRISEGTRVLFAGKPVGEVVAVKTLHDARENAADSQGRLYYYELTLKIDSSVRVYNTDEISTYSAGLMGEKVISITPKAPAIGTTPEPLNTTHPIYADSVDAFASAWGELSDLSQEMKGTFKEITGWMQKNGNEVGLAVQKARSTMNEIEKTLTTVNEGEGTIGRLVAGDDMYLSVHAIMSKLNTLMNDVNHYGILFHLNKSWQRTRLQKATALNALSNPVSFKNYFVQEVDAINTSMERLSMLIDRAQQTGQKEAILQNQQFQNDFAELLRQSEELSDNLRFYNEQLMEAKGK